MANHSVNTYTGSVRFPSSREARLALTGSPGSKLMAYLSYVFSTVPPFPKSLYHTDKGRHKVIYLYIIRSMYAIGKL